MSRLIKAETLHEEIASLSISITGTQNIKSFNAGVAAAKASITQMIVDAPTVEPVEWMPVEIAVPHHDIAVRVKGNNGTELCAYRASTNWFEWTEKNSETILTGITHWMPLPAAART